MLPLLIAIPVSPAPGPSASVVAVTREATSRTHGALSKATSIQGAQPGEQPIPEHAPQGYPYISLQGGITRAESLSGFDRTALQSPLFRFNPGTNGELAIGYQFANHTRLEISAGYLQASPSSLSLSAAGTPMAVVDAGGELGLFTAMVNGILEFPLRDRAGRVQGITPYVGAGIGLGNLTVPHCATSASTCLLVNPVNTLAYQFKAGLSYRAALRTSVFLEGGYIGTLDTTFRNENGEVSYDRVGALRLNLGFRQGF